MVAPYKAGTVNHVTKNEQQRLWLLHIRLVQSTMPQKMNGKDYGSSILS